MHSIPNDSVEAKSRLKSDVSEYLVSLTTKAAALPEYFPEQLRDSDVNGASFDAIHQHYGSSTIVGSLSAG